MSQSDMLRKSTEQHKPKNKKSKQDDKAIYGAMHMVIAYLKERFVFETQFPDYEITFADRLSVDYMIHFLQRHKIREEFDLTYLDRSIIPDGGVLFLEQKSTGTKKPLLISEIKRQGTNDQRAMEGKETQATGNAIERLGKNLIGIKTMMNYEKITPFVCFGWGCDFSAESKTVLAKVSMLNEFYPLNRTYVFKRDGTSDFKSFSPVSMYFREDSWGKQEMFDIMKEIAETSLRYYLY